MKCSIIFNVLESQRIVTYQALHYEKILPDDFEVIFIDDGSPGPLVLPNNITKNIKMLRREDPRPWTQSCARNYGFKHSTGDYCLFCDIDHIITKDIIEFCKEFKGDKAEFSRAWGILNEKGDILTDKETMIQYGLKEKDYGKKGKPYNIFLIRRDIFKTIGGYDEKHAGSYGNEDVSFANAYRDLHREGKVSRSKAGPLMYVYPDPRRDVKNLFHSLR